MADSKITVEIVGDKKNLDSILGSVNNDVDSFGANMVKVGKALATAVAAGFTAIVGGATVAVNEFNDFEKGMNEVFTLLPGISGKAMREMEDQVLSFSREMNVLPEEVVPALYQALSAGVPPDNVFDFLETAVKLSKGGVTDLETAVDGLSSVVNAYGAETISAEQASDILFTTVKLGKTTVGELSGELSGVTPIAASLGVKFGDLGAAIALITSQGTGTAEAVTGLRALLVELGDSGTEVGRRFEEIAGQSFPEFIASGHDLGDAMEIVQQISDETGIPVQQLFSSIEAGTAATQLTGKSLDKFRDNLDAMADSAGATDKAYAQMKKGLSESFASLQAELQVVAIQAGRELAPALQDLAKVIERDADDIAAAVIAIAKGTAAFLTEIVGQISDFMDALDSDTSRGSKALRDFKSDTAAEVEEVTSDWDRMKKAIKTLSFGEILGLLVDDFTHVSKAEQEFTDQIASGLKFAAQVVIDFADVALNAFTLFATGILDAAIQAFGWVPGLGDKLRAARDNIEEFRQKGNAELDQLRNRVDVFFEGHDNVSDKIEVIRENIRGLQREIYADNPPGPLLDPTQGGPRIGVPGGGGSGGLNPYDDGGRIPGPPGALVPIMGHAGETVLPTHKMSAEQALRHVGLSRDDIAYGTAAGVQMAGGFGDQTSIGTVNVQAGSTDPTDVVELLAERQRRHALLGSS